MFRKTLIVTLLILFFGFEGLPALAQQAPLDTNFQFDLGVVTHDDIEQADYARTGINFIFTRIITILAATVGSAAVLTMVIGGFLIMTSNGIQEQIDRGKNLIKKALIGLVFVLGAYIIVSTIQLLVTTVV